MPPSAPTPAHLEDRRQTVVEALSAQFVADDVELSTYEQRLEAVYDADSIVQIDRLAEQYGLADPTASPSRALVEERAVPEVETAVAVLGSTSRRGTWSVPRTTYAVSALGNVHLDFREARLGAGVTEVQVFTLMGGVELIVPPDVEVEVSAVGILGSVDDIARTRDRTERDRPVIRVTGVALLGSIEIKTRLVGETPRMARRRCKAERKARANRLMPGRFAR